MDNDGKQMYNMAEKQEGGCKLLEKFASLLLSLLLCLSLLPGQARAGDLPEPPAFPVVEEPVEPEEPGEPVMPTSEEPPDEGQSNHNT